MTPIPGKPNHFNVQLGETITARVTHQQNTKDLVNYTWNNVGQPSQPINQPLSPPPVANSQNVLGVGVFFNDLNGGAFIVELSGNMGGVPFLDPVSDGGDFTNEVYWFEV